MSQSSLPKPLKKHPGIRIEKIPVRGAAGLFFALGVMFIFWVGVPTIRGFVILGALGGLVAFAGLRWWRNRDQAPTARQMLFTETTSPVSRADRAGRSGQPPTQD